MEEFKKISETSMSRRRRRRLIFEDEDVDEDMEHDMSVLRRLKSM